MLRKDLSAALSRPPRRIDGSDRRSAVAAIFDGRDHLLLIRRAERAGDPWSGHLSFPGGRMEAADPSPFDAAIRETREEIGLSLRPESLVGSLDDLVAVGGAPGMVIHPYVFLEEGLDIPAFAEAFRPNAEVASVLAWPFQSLRDGTGRGTMELVRSGNRWVLPCVDIDGQRLWGLTLRMVDDLIERITILNQ